MGGVGTGGGKKERISIDLGKIPQIKMEAGEV